MVYTSRHACLMDQLLTLRSKELGLQWAVSYDSYSLVLPCAYWLFLQGPFMFYRFFACLYIYIALLYSERCVVMGVVVTSRSIARINGKGVVMADDMAYTEKISNLL